jgi:hypothetical protein
MTQDNDKPKRASSRQRKRHKAAFYAAVDARRFEIGLFWQRSLFFWGFIAAALVAFAALRKDSPRAATAVAAFGVVCSIVWTLANRGSKYWQEAWETKVEREEPFVTGRLFSKIENEHNKGWWLRGRRYSVSRLAIALSDYVAFLWIALLVGQVAMTIDMQSWPYLHFKDVCVLAFALGSIGYAGSLLINARVAVDQSSNEDADNL